MRFNCLLFLGLSLLLGFHSIDAEESTDQWTTGHEIICPPVWSGTIEEMISHSPKLSNEESAQESKKIRRALRLKYYKEDLPEAPLLSFLNLTLQTREIPSFQSIIRAISFTTRKPNFTATTLFETFAVPPDSMGVVGPTQFIAFCNGRLKSFNKNGVADGVLDIDPDQFFASVITPGGRTSDPRIRYDRLTKTWFLVMIDVPPSSATNRILIALTRSPTITSQSMWTFYYFQPSASYGANVIPFADFPTLGIDANALYIGANIFDDSDGFLNSAGYVIPKQPLLQSGTLKVTEFPKLINETTFAGPITPQGVDNFNTRSSLGFFIGVDASVHGRLMLRQVKTPGTTPQISGNIPITVLSTANPLNVPHLGNNNGTNGYLDGLDDRLGNAHIRGQFLYTSHNLGVNDQGVSSSSVNITRNGCRWYQISLKDPNNPTLVQAATLFQSGAPSSTQERFFWIPSVMTNGLHDLVLGCSTAGAKVHIDAAFAQHFATDAKGTIRAPFLYTQSTTAYNPAFDPGGPGGRRWGDYSHVSLDPNDNMTLWTIQEFCNAQNSYGVQVLRILAPPPPELASVTPATISPNQKSVTITIKGANQPPRAFYDPGAGFVKRLKVTISGVKVLSKKVIDRRTLRVVVSTVGSTKGKKTITVINPDDQKVVASGLLTVQ